MAPMQPNQALIQSVFLVSIPTAAMVLGGLYPLVISGDAPNKKLSFALQHFAGYLNTMPLYSLACFGHRAPA
jgi:hypothetical protein